MIYSSEENHGEEISDTQDCSKRVHYNKKSVGCHRLSKKYYPGSKAFIYYNRFEEPKYMFSSDMPEPQSIPDLIEKIFTPLFVIFIAEFWMIMHLIPAQKLDPLPEFETVHICDDASVFDNTAKLESSLKSFEDATGICPYIHTINISDISECGKAYESNDTYSRTFTDQQHLLIVYYIADHKTASIPDGWTLKADDQSDYMWSCEVFDGLSTRTIISDNGLMMIQNELNKNLSMDSVTTVDAFTKTIIDAKKFIFSFKAKSEITHIVLFCEAMWLLPIIIFLINNIIASIRYYIYSHKKYFPAPYDDFNP